jgi:hypothetical protein
MRKRSDGSSLLAIAGLAIEILLPATAMFTPAPAHAIVGRPATPVSVAGVARRTTRRAVVATTAVATPAPTVVVVQTPPPPKP